MQKDNPVSIVKLNSNETIEDPAKCNGNGSNSVSVGNNNNYMVLSLSPDTILIQKSPAVQKLQGVISAKKKKALWKKDIRKQKRLKGEEYEGFRGIVHAARPMLPCPCAGKTTHNCIASVNEEKRKEIYSIFRNLENIDEQLQFLQRHVEQVPKKRTTRNIENSRRSHTNYYSLTVDGKKEQVCRNFFMATLNVTDATIRSALKKCSSTGAFQKDRRGRHPPKNKITAENEEFLRNHIASFRAVKAIGCKKLTQKTYLKSSLNISIMHKMYKEACAKEGKRPVALEKYRLVFKEYNLDFRKHKKT